MATRTFQKKKKKKKKEPTKRNQKLHVISFEE
jgi:hypothetical protein